MSIALHRLRWIAPVMVLTVAALLRLWGLGRPDSLVFDEIYYVRDAVSQLAHGFTTTWPDDDPAFGGERARSFSDQPNAIAHPPLGKWLIALGIMLLGPDSGWGWRLSAALAGVVTVGITMRLGFLMSRSLVIGCLAGLLLAVDGVHVTLSRVGLLDIFLTLFVALGALFVWHDQIAHGRAAARGRITWRRPWLLAAGLAFGAATAVKWSGLYALAAFLIVIALRDWWLRRRFRPHRERGRPVVRALLQTGVTALVALPAAALAYLASWVGWILSPTAQNRSPGEPWWASLWQWHVDALAWHSTLSAPHPYQSHPLGWPLALRPTAMYEVSWGADEGCRWAAGCVSAISPLPNPLVTWGGVAALLLLAWAVARAVAGSVRAGWIGPATGRPVPRSPLADAAFWSAAFVLTGFLSGWLPWLLTFSRSAVFQFYAVVLTPFTALALALVLGACASLPASLPASLSSAASTRGRSVLALAGLHPEATTEAVLGRRIAVAVFAVMTVVLGILFFSSWSGLPTAEWFWHAHLWLPGWD